MSCRDLLPVFVAVCVCADYAHAHVCIHDHIDKLMQKVPLEQRMGPGSTEPNHGRQLSSLTLKPIRIFFDTSKLQAGK